jgi:hypothetical protein
VNRIKLVPCPFCSALVGAGCRGSRHPITGRERFHRARIEHAVRAVGLTEPKPQPAQLRYHQKSLLP